MGNFHVSSIWYQKPYNKIHNLGILDFLMVVHKVIGYRNAYQIVSDYNDLGDLPILVVSTLVSTSTKEMYETYLTYLSRM